VNGANYARWSKLGLEKSVLGYPTTDVQTTPDGAGRYNHFQHGSIYWKPEIGSHEVHGSIRKHWAAGGWEKGPLGYPISNETHVSNDSPDRFGDFENGVVYWKSGSAEATDLAKFTLAGASKSVTEVFSGISKLLVPLLSGQVDGRQLYITSGPTLGGPDPIGSNAGNLFAPVTGYWLTGDTARNRMYKTRTAFGITVDGSADVRVIFDLWVEVYYDASKRTVFASPRYFWLDTTVPWPTSWFETATEVNDALKQVIQPQINLLHAMGTVPAGINVLALKVMPNGDLNFYVAP
jgi:hypothetical protein